MLHSLKTALRRFISEKFKLKRPSSWPFITADTFRSLAQHAHDEISVVDPSLVHENDIVFVRRSFINEFFSQIDPLIKCKYVLISNNDDASVTDAEARQMLKKSKITAWFVQNAAFKHERIIPIPIGLPNFFYGANELLSSAATLASSKKTGLLSWGFGILNYQTERILAAKILAKFPWAAKISSSSQSEYYEFISKYKFLVSPAGNGEDCHRTWEALLLGVMPICKRTLMTEYFVSLGLPIYLIDEWNDLAGIEPETLEAFYDEHKSELASPAIYMPYWAEKIAQAKYGLLD